MAEELMMKDLQMKSLTDKLTTILGKIPKAQKKGNGDKLLNDAANKLMEFQLAYDSSAIELRINGAMIDNKSELKASLREHKIALRDLRSEYESYKSGSIKDELLGDYVENGPDKNNPDALMQHGLSVQDQSKQSLQVCCLYMCICNTAINH